MLYRATQPSQRSNFWTIRSSICIHSWRSSLCFASKFANRKMAWLSAQSGPPTALARVETSHEVEFLVKSEEENLAELMFEERARREAEEKKANLAAQIAAAKATMGARVAALLNEKLAKSWQKISSLFRSWDVDGDGWITKREFAKGMGVLGLGVSPDDVDELFAWFDPDNSGTIEFGELNTLLRRGQTIEVDGLALQSAPRVRQPGGLISHGKTTLGFERGRTQLRERAEHGSVLGGRDVLTEAKDYAAVVATLRARLAERHGRIFDLFTQWDGDSDGAISLPEFRGAMALLGLDAPRDVVAACFAQFDPDGSGSISFAELKRGLTKPVTEEPTVVARPRTAKKGRGRVAGGLGGAVADGADGAPPHVRLRKALSKHSTRVVDVSRATALPPAAALRGRV